jgi:glutathione S-transferase
MKLYGLTPSPFYRKCRVAFEEKGLAYEVEPCAPIPKTPELIARHPLGKIPYLVDGELTVPDSSVICAYLEKLQPAPPLYPETADEFAQALFLEEYADTRISEVVGGIVYERLVRPHVLKEEPDEERVASILRDELPGVLDYVESRAPESGDHIFSRFGIADIALGAHLSGLHFGQVELDAARWPRTAAYLASLLARPSFKTAMT